MAKTETKHNNKKKTAGLQFNLGLVLIHLWTSGPRFWDFKDLKKKFYVVWACSVKNDFKMW